MICISGILYLHDLNDLEGQVVVRESNGHGYRIKFALLNRILGTTLNQSKSTKTGSEKLPGIRHGGKILADQLAIQSCEAVFCVAGESFLPALDGLYDHPSIKTVTCRHEGGAAIMAEAWGKMTGRPAVCFVTRGPGATNACLGVHIAQQDSTPMVLMIGQVQRKFLDREAFQEVDFRTMFRPLAKWVAQVEDTTRIPEYVSRAWHTAMSGRPGPVVLVFPGRCAVSGREGCGHSCCEHIRSTCTCEY